MKGYRIDAASRTVTPIDYEYRTMRDHLPGGLCIAAVFGNGDVIYVDDEALTRPSTVAFRIKRRTDGQPMMSNGLVTGRDDADGTLPPASTIAQIEAEIEWMDLADALAWFRAKGDEEAVVLTSSTGERQVLETWAGFLSLMTK